MNTFNLLVFPICILANFCYCGDVTPLAFGSDVDMMPAAFGDFDSDELTDLFVIRNKSTVEILLGSTVEPYFRRSPRLKCSFKTHIITSVVPGDFDGDALMDVLVTTYSKHDKELSYVYILWGGLNHLNCTDEDNVLFKMIDEPLAIDHSRNMTVDLFGLDEHGSRGFWISKGNRTGFDWKPMTSDDRDVKNISLRVPHSHAFLDLSDDNSPDLYLTTVSSYEIWLWDNENSSFVFNNTIPFPAGLTSRNVGQTLFMDVEIANKMDQVIPVCLDFSGGDCKNSAIYVYSKDRWYNLNVNFQDDENGIWNFAKDGQYINAITLRGGDFNMDGYPDMLSTLVNRGKRKVFLLENVECESKCGGFTRTFKIQWYPFIRWSSDTVMGAFYDFLQDGVLDIIFVHRQKDGSPRVSAFKNSLDYDANFIKVMVITGLTNSEIELPPTILGTKRHTFGTNLPGPKVSYQTTTQEGNLRIGVSSQLPQSAHFSLYLPYTIFGLGRTPNFVEDLTVGMFNETRTWTQIIPNSQLVVIPYPTDNPYKWRAQMFVTPSKIILQSVIALLGVCFVILVITGLLHWKERREDKIEKQQEAQRFHFDAM